MSQTVLAAGGDDNPRDEMKSFGDEGDEAEAAEHLDDELGLKQELENGDDRLVSKVFMFVLIVVAACISNFLSLRRRRTSKGRRVCQRDGVFCSFCLLSETSRRAKGVR